MKQKLKNYLKFGILLFGISLLTTNCNKDDLSLQPETLETTTGYKSREISNKEIKANGSITKILEKLKDNKSDNNTFNKEVYDSINDFTIETDDAIYITNQEYHSYTFSITRPIDNGLTENLFLSLQADQTYKAYIVEYTLTDLEKEQILNGNSVNLEGKSTISLLRDFNISSILEKDPNKCYKKMYVLHPNMETLTPVEVEVDCPPNYDADDTIDAGDSADGGGNSGTPDDSSPVNDDNTGNNTTTDGGTQNTGDPGSNSNPTSGGDASNPDGDTNGDDTTSPEDDCILDANGECIGDATTPKIKETQTLTEDEKNCKELNKLTANPNVNTPHPAVNGDTKKYPRLAIIGITSSLSSGSENSFSFRNVGNFDTYGALAVNVQSSEDNKVHLNKDPREFGYVHVHPISSLIGPMFSSKDILSLLTIRGNYTYTNDSNLNPNGNSIFVSMLVAKQGDETMTYAIKIDDFNKYQGIEQKKSSNKKWKDFSKKLRLLYKEQANGSNGTSNQYQRAFLNFIKNQDLGLSLYKMNPNDLDNPVQLETWEKLTLDENSITGIKNTPCNL